MVRWWGGKEGRRIGSAHTSRVAALRSAAALARFHILCISDHTGGALRNASGLDTADSTAARPGNFTHTSALSASTTGQHKAVK